MAEFINIHQFVGVVASYTVKDEGGIVVHFKTLSKSGNNLTSVFATLNEDIHLARYIKDVVPVTVVLGELPSKDDKRQFEVISILSDRDLEAFNKLKAIETQREQASEEEPIPPEDAN